MRKYVILWAAAVLLLLLLPACHQNDIPEESSSESASQSSLGAETDPALPTIASETSSPGTETQPELFESVEPVPEAQIHTASVDIREVGENTVSVLNLTQDMAKGKTHVRIIPSLGYACDGFMYDGILYAGDVLPLSILKKETELILRISYATYELPIVNIRVDGQEINSKTNYVPMSFSVENTEDIMLGVSGGIRIRGNSTANMPKKPYRIKFDQKQSLFGLDKAKSWVLLAEYLDPSCLHNYAAMYLGASSDQLTFTPTIHQVNLYLDGEYMGLYSLCEQIDEDRLGIEQEIKSSMKQLMDFSFLVCMDERAPEEDEPYFYVPSVGRYFQLVYPNREDFASTRQFDRFMNQLETYYNEMADAFNQKNNAWFKKNIYTDTLIDHLIIDQIMGEKDHIWKSFYTYHNAVDESLQGKIGFGPIWDYDYSLYMPWTGEPNECYDIDEGVHYSNFFYGGIIGSRYESKIGTRYTQHFSDVLSDLVKDLRSYHDSIQQSLALNQERWYAYDPDLTDDNYQFMLKFLKSRQKVLKRAWG